MKTFVVETSYYQSPFLLRELLRYLRDSMPVAHVYDITPFALYLFGQPF